MLKSNFFVNSALEFSNAELELNSLVMQKYILDCIKNIFGIILLSVAKPGINLLSKKKNIKKGNLFEVPFFYINR